MPISTFPRHDYDEDEYILKTAGLRDTHSEGKVNPTAFVTLKKNWSNQPRSRSVEDVQEILDKARCRARGEHRSERTRLLAIRDWAIMEFLYGTGVRRAECCWIDLFNLNTE